MLKIIKQYFLISGLLGGLIAALTFVFSLNTNYPYKATVKVLIVQDQLGTQDYYSLTKSAEYLGTILEEAVYSTTFIDIVRETESVDKNLLPTGRKEQLKKWKNIVKFDKSSGLGILTVNVFGNKKEDSYKLAQVIADILQHKNYLFRGKTNVDVRLLSDVIIDRNPDLKTLILATTGGFVLGFILSIIFFYYKRIYKHTRLISGSSLFL